MQFSRSHPLGSSSVTEKEKALEAHRGERKREREGETRTPCQQANTILTNESTQSYINSVDIDLGKLG